MLTEIAHLHPALGDETPRVRSCADRPAKLTAEIVTTRASLARLALRWNALLAQSEAPTIFLTWEWIDAWLEAVQPAADPVVIAIHDGAGRLTALAPFYRSELRFLRLLPVRCLRMLGDVESGAEYPDLVIRPDCAEPSLALIRKSLLDAGAWDCLWIRNVSDWNGAARRWRSLRSPRIPHCNERTRDFAFIPLPETYDHYLVSLSGNTRSIITRRTKQLLRTCSVELVRCESETDLDVLLDALFDLHRRRWRLEGEAGCFAREPRMADFYRRFGKVALHRGWLRLFALKLDGHIRAVQHGYAYEGVFSQMQEGFDPDAPVGIGNVLRSMVLKACIEERLREYDFLGGFSEHKRRWGAQLRNGRDLFMGHGSLKNRLLFARAVWPTGRCFSHPPAGGAR